MSERETALKELIRRWLVVADEHRRYIEDGRAFEVERCAEELAAVVATPAPPPCEWREKVPGSGVFRSACKSHAKPVNRVVLDGFGFTKCGHCGSPLVLVPAAQEK